MAKAGAKSGVVEEKQRRQLGRVAVGRRRKVRLAARQRPMVPRTDLLAYVATEDPIAQRRPQVRRDGTGQLDGQIADAAAGVELPGIDQRAGGTSVEARPAGPAVARLDRRVVAQRFGRQQCGEKEPASQPPVQEQGVLADPSQAGQLGELPLQERRRVDHPADPGPRHELAMEVGQSMQLGVEQVVVVVAQGVAGDISLA